MLSVKPPVSASAIRHTCVSHLETLLATWTLIFSHAISVISSLAGPCSF